VLDEQGKVEITRVGEKGKLSISVDPGKHRLKVEKDGFSLFTDNFEIESGGEKAITARLEPLVATDAKTVPAELPTLDTAAWKAILPADAPVPAIAPFDAITARKHQEAWADYLGEPVEQEVHLGNGVKLTMVLIPPGEFDMGSTEKERAAFLEEAKSENDRGSMEQIPTEGPQHRVRITRPFRLGRQEVTVGQFRQFVDQTGYKTDAEQDGKGAKCLVHPDWIQDPRFGWSDAGYEQTDEHPVVNVTWNDAMAFCQWLSDKEEGEFVLPSEAQWEYACRAGTSTMWICGDSNTALEECAWYNGNSGWMAHPTGRLKPSGWSLYDMPGNVSEWCADYWSTGYYARSPVNDPTGSTMGWHRVIRGGCWCNRAGRCRSARRSSGLKYRRNIVGFRVAMVLVDSTADAITSTPKADESGAEVETTQQRDGATWTDILPPDAPPPAVAPFAPEQAKQHQQETPEHVTEPETEAPSGRPAKDATHNENTATDQ
jgi:formylglycine-generating enzyme required for sulfatase activity